MLSAAAETFLADHPATVAARAAAGGHGPAVTPATPARSMPGRPTAFQSIPPFPPQVSRFILPGRAAFRLLVACGCPFGWDTPDMPDVVVCPKHGSTRVASGSSSETWSGGPLPLAVPAEPELSAAQVGTGLAVMPGGAQANLPVKGVVNEGESGT